MATSNHAANFDRLCATSPNTGIQQARNGHSQPFPDKVIGLPLMFEQENLFAEVSAKSVIKLQERKFVTKAETDKLLDACINHDGLVIVSLARYGGLRCPSEVLSLRWQDVDWDKKRITVQSPKTSSQGKDSRMIPLFPELKQVLDEAWELAPEGAVYVVDEKYRRAGW